MKSSKIYNPIFKEKIECQLCLKIKNLTFHHIIPKREIIFNGYDNIMVLCRKCHNIIDISKVQRDEFCYIKNKIIIDKYNDYLIQNQFDDDLLWKIYKEENIVKHKNKKKKRNKKNLICNIVKGKKEKLYSKSYLKLLDEKQKKYRIIQIKRDKEEKEKC